MKRHEVTAVMRSFGSRLDYSGDTFAWYVFPSEGKALEARQRIPYQTTFNGEKGEGHWFLTVHFDKIKETDAKPFPACASQIFDADALERCVIEAIKQYEKSAPTVASYADSVYMRLASCEKDEVRLSELRFIANLCTPEGVWMHPNTAANLCYKLMNRLGMDTTGHAGF